MNSESQCPTIDELSGLVDGSLNRRRAAAISVHLDVCTACLEALDRMDARSEPVQLDRIQSQQCFRFRGEPGFSLLQARVRQIAIDASKSNDRSKELSDTVSLHSTDLDTSFSCDPVLDSREMVGELEMLQPPEQGGEIGRIGGYRVLEILGAGGMGMVFRAKDPKLKRSVALKVMKPSSKSSRTARDRFLLEAQAAAAIEHDNVVAIHQVGEDHGVPFIAMPMLKGESLRSMLVREGQLKEADAIQIGRQVAQGLAAAHAMGLIHRDIKPDNIWIEKGSRRAKILDFGLARMDDHDANLTHSGTVLGTPRYMSPEQADGRLVDHRSDLFSLGCVLYHAVSGKLPFSGESLTAVLLAVSQADPIPIQEVAPEIQPALGSLISRLLNQDADQRPQAASEVVEALKAIQSNALPPPTNVKHSNKLLRGWLVLGFGAILAAGFFVLAQYRRPAATITDHDELHSLTSPMSKFPLIMGSQIRTFRQGESGYNQAVDTEIRESKPNADRGDEPAAAVDLDRDSDFAGNDPSHYLIRFSNIIGEQDSQIPQGAVVRWAKLSVHVTNASTPSSQVSISRMLVPWDEGSNWNSMESGISADDGECDAISDDTVSGNVEPLPARLEFDVTRSVNAWVNGAVAEGWFVALNDPNGMQFSSCNAPNVAVRPQLTVCFESSSEVQMTAGGHLPTPDDDVFDGLPLAMPQSSLALRLDRHDEATIPLLHLNPLKSVTIELWVLPTVAPPEGVDDQFLLSLQRNHQLKLETTNEHGVVGPRWEYKVKMHGNSLVIRPRDPIQLSQWTHLACVHDGKESRMYVNGELVASSEQDGILKYSDQTLQIGCSEQTQDYAGFIGLVREVRISSIPRYSGPFTPKLRFEPDPETIALYHCDQNTGDVLKDESGHNYDGEIHGGTWEKCSNSRKQATP